jgi:transposase
MFTMMQPQTKELTMRGDRREEDQLFSYIPLEDRVPASHPLRVIRQFVDPILAELSPRFDAIYAKTGRPSIPPEQLLRALLLQVLYTVRSERMLCEQLEYNLLFRWFVGLGMDGQVWVPTVFTKNRDRLLQGEIAEAFFAAVLAIFYEHVRAESPRLARAQDLLHGPWFAIGHGCHCTRDTAAAIERSPLEMTELEREEMSGLPPLVKPFIRGVATQPT